MARGGVVREGVARKGVGRGGVARKGVATEGGANGGVKEDLAGKGGAWEEVARAKEGVARHHGGGGGVGGWGAWGAVVTRTLSAEPEEAAAEEAAAAKAAAATAVKRVVVAVAVAVRWGVAGAWEAAMAGARAEVVREGVAETDRQYVSQQYICLIENHSCIPCTSCTFHYA